MAVEKQEPRQILVVRSDLRNTEGHKVRTGKLIAQAAHASLKAIIDASETKIELADDMEISEMTLEIDITPNRFPALHEWLHKKFTKVCVSVNSEQELLEVYKQAKEAGLLCSIIQDSGLTEFGGVSTFTCCAVGPAYPDELQPITGHLKLL